MNTRKPFEKATPEQVGIKSSLILEYIDNLEKSQTEMHHLPDNKALIVLELSHKLTVWIC